MIDQLFLKFSYWQNTYLFQNILVILAVLMAGIGIVLILKAYFSALPNSQIEGESREKHKYKIPLIRGCIGVILLFLTGIIVIYIYAIQPSSQRVIKDSQNKKSEDLPDISHRDLKDKLGQHELC